MTLLNKIKELLSLGSANLISSIIYGLFWIFLATILTTEDYGEIGFFISVANIGSSVALLGIGGTIVVYEAKKQNIFPAGLVIVLISSAITSVFAFVLTQNLIVSVLLFGMTLFYVTLSGLNGNKRYRDYSTHLILRASVTIGLSLILFQFYGINGILFAYFVSSLLIIKELKSLLKNKEFNFSVLRSKVNFIVFTYGNRISRVLLWSGDKLLIGSMFGFSFLGNYYFAAQVLMLLDTIPRVISLYLIPQESEGQKNKKLKIFSIIVACLIALISIILAPILVKELLPQYEETIVPIQILSLAIIPLSISMIQQSEFLGRENPKFVLLGSALQSILYLILIVVLGQSYGLLGIASGFLISTIFRTLFNIIGRNKN